MGVGFSLVLHNILFLYLVGLSIALKILKVTYFDFYLLYILIGKDLPFGLHMHRFSEKKQMLIFTDTRGSINVHLVSSQLCGRFGIMEISLAF